MHSHVRAWVRACIIVMVYVNNSVGKRCWRRWALLGGGGHEDGESVGRSDYVALLSAATMARVAR